jgi:hypothetical protein
VTMTTIEFCEKLAEQVPEIKTMLQEHLDDCDQLLPHVFFGDLARYVLSDGPGRLKMVEFLEQSFHRFGSEIEELIAVSFIENLESEYDLEHALRGLTAPNLKTEWRRQKLE